MTEEMIKECKNCDALGIDSEIGVYYCCLSHRQDDLPKEFTCNDFTPNKQLKRLEQREKALTEIADDLQKRNHNLTLINERLGQENKELKEVKEQLKKWNDENLKRQDDMQLWIDLAEEQRRNYRSALEEIRKITEELCEQKSCEEDTHRYSCHYEDTKNILDKINEVLK